MPGAPNPPTQANKVVVAFLDGRRVRGYVYNFSALRDAFSVFPQENSRKQDAVEIKMKDLKAIFFVKDFAGNREYQDDPLPELLKRGRKIEAAFSDGETLVGATEAYHPQKSGFFMFLADPKGNNTRVFVVNKNLRHIKFL